ncbi:hypothetical protein PUN28_012207 [Cardiocondyla obscurior]|uniref:Uncharacterized protein n=1 Tax=Cardiocondyla obscurior TaxID=286306 RepID=A0AAW2FA04_9HYME
MLEMGLEHAKLRRSSLCESSLSSLYIAISSSSSSSKSSSCSSSSSSSSASSFSSSSSSSPFSLLESEHIEHDVLEHVESIKICRYKTSLKFCRVFKDLLILT